MFDVKLIRSLVAGIACCLLASTSIFAKEPANLAFIKQQLVHYHTSGDYDNDIKSIINDAMHYLKIRLSRPFPAGKKPAIVLDIDETSLSNFNGMKRLDFGGTLDDIRAEQDKGTGAAINATLKLYNFAKANNITVFFLTGRLSIERDVTETNLKKAGYNNWEKLILREGKFLTAPAATYKTMMRKQITEQGYNIILNIGDQKSDLVGGYADKTFKLPNPYYLIP